MSEAATPQAWELTDLPLHRLIALGRRAERKDYAIRVAVAGDCATQHYCQALSAVLKLRGWWPEIYEAEYGTIQQELLNPKSGLYQHDPEFIVLFMVTQALRNRFASAEDKAAFAETILDEISTLWKQIASHSQATIVQHTFVVPLERPFGNQTLLHIGTFAGAVSRINSRLIELASQQRVRIIDTESQAAYFGKRHWIDERLWCQARQGLSPSFIPPLVKNVSDTLLAEVGVGIKCLVLDLDNTLWGGILADDGPALIEIGQTEVGLVFNRFQHSLLELKARGVLLAICSKNSQADVMDVLENHPDMILQKHDFAAIVANFDDKVSNLNVIREKLNLGFDSFIFLDDTPFERDLVRTALPQIQVPELPIDPANVVGDLSRWNLFEGRAATSEDIERLSYYKVDEEREAIRAKFHGLDAYLADLAMEAEVLRFDRFALPRVLQLVQRSNQFNLTTIRHSEGALTKFAAAADAAPFCIRLTDRLGDNGIIAVVILQKQGSDAVIDTWIMSCRVLGRGVEDLTLDRIMDRAKLLGCQRVIGRYAPTAKNAMVAKLYERLGFSEVGLDGATQLFALDADAVQGKKFPIKCHEQETTA